MLSFNPYNRTQRASLSFTSRWGHRDKDYVNNLCKVTTANETLETSGTSSLSCIITYCPIPEDHSVLWSRLHGSSVYYPNKIYASKKPVLSNRTWSYIIAANYTLNEWVFFFRWKYQSNWWWANMNSMNGMFESEMSLVRSRVFFWWCLCLRGLFPLWTRVLARFKGCKQAVCHWSALLPDWCLFRANHLRFLMPKAFSRPSLYSQDGLHFPKLWAKSKLSWYPVFKSFITEVRKANNTIVSYSKASFQF